MQNSCHELGKPTRKQHTEAGKMDWITTFLLIIGIATALCLGVSFIRFLLENPCSGEESGSDNEAADMDA